MGIVHYKINQKLWGSWGMGPAESLFLTDRRSESVCVCVMVVVVVVVVHECPCPHQL